MGKIKKEYIQEYKRRAREMVSQMTLEEKVSQLLFEAKAVERLGIKEYCWWNEALHGVARAGVATMFPQAIALGATFDTELINRVGQVIATEGRAKYNIAQRAGEYRIYKGLTFWSPNVNIFRDPRWGRGHETYGEDPYLTSRLGVAFINGVEGEDERYLKAAACAKHFAVHSGPEALRHEFNAVVSKRDLHETYLPAFKACVEEAGVEGVMGAYNRTNGEVCCGSPALLVEILRGRWGFDGYVTSDCWAIQDFHMYHKVTSEPCESVALALENGCDLNCGCTYEHAVNAVKRGLVSEELIDESCTRVLTTRMKLGEFDKDVPYNNIPFSAVACPEHRALALETARRSLVLLKNNGTLPLKKRKGLKIGVIGPNANSKIALQGNYCGTATRYVTVLEGMQDFCEKDGMRVYFSEGCHIVKDTISWQRNDRLDEVIAICEECDVVIGVFGLDETIEGEESPEMYGDLKGDKKDLSLPGIQDEIIKEIGARAKKSILVMMSGSAIDMCEYDQMYDAIIQGWYPGEKGGEAIAELIFGMFSPQGKLPLTFYKSSEDLPPFEDYSMKGRTYRYFEGEPLYPFGYGLTYTNHFAYGVRLNDDKITEKPIDVSVFVNNESEYEGADILQVYVKAKREGAPLYSLKHFERVELRANEDKTVSFKLDPSAFALANENGEFVIERGEYSLFIGFNQPDPRSTMLTGKAPLELKLIRE
ncbi:MAG: glycoside hydrolase family 3 C-terminal domain-containing protein [Clostridia bacterium]|nr:glycoside hydrolase family 3 C-terminal domain-containing protein [Clostridia bacterium]MBQ7907776.1 glycoside hydrolase family 3 C-terminal domain-containing protein [Clostridia bacterium]